MDPRCILVVEDDRAIRQGIVDALQFAGYETLQAANGRDGLAQALRGSFDLLLLDLILPGQNGFEILKATREARPTLPVIILTARGEEADRVQGLRLGADDYVVKPFSPEELVARAEALLRRVHKKGVTPVMSYQFGNVTVDFVRSKALKDHKPINLTAKEWDLLRLLVNNRGQVLTRDAILGKVWAEQKFITPRTVDVHIAWLRQKLEDAPQSPAYIVTVRGEGYRFVP